MCVFELMDRRRAYRSLEPFEVTEDLIQKLAWSAGIAPSCFNNQPWRYVFVYEKKRLEELFTSLARGNEWAKASSFVIAVFSKPEYDCRIKGRDYYLFDTGMATAFLILGATELGLVAHPIAGFNEVRVKEILGIPDDMIVITLVILGRHAEALSPILTEKQIESEKKRPERLPSEKIVYRNSYNQ